ncbi:hypothetical protein QBC37DRAFT_107181 [Rhypophila decipiens]|uniref:Uncharacterized protein n=1 Tax=Rhypophila decipiens TaxID=261697 RepID=A0AAN7AZ97_9PEZI|nr:hypothetical protein QBC37DRAFT_107181 [Rhypophila decipiens]
MAVQDEKTAGSSSITSPAAEVAWHPSFRRRFPWLGFIGFVMVFCGTVLAIFFLVHSNGQLVAEWPTKAYPVTPNVLVNAANQIAAFGLVTAIGHGFAIAWWRKSVQGTTLEALHHDYRYANSFLAILTSGKRFNTMALAALMTKFIIVDSTLFQKSTRTVLRHRDGYATAPVQAFLTPDWTPGTGGIPGFDGDIETFDVRFADVINGFNTKFANNKVHDTQILFTGCPPAQSCTGDLIATGFGFDCNLTTESVDYGANRSNTNFSRLWSVSFDPDWASEAEGYAHIHLDMIYVDSANGPNNTCPGTLTRRHCMIRPAVVKYPLLIQAADPVQSVNVTHLGFSIPQNYTYNSPMPGDDDQIDHISLVKYTNLPEMFGERSIVGGLSLALNNLFASSASLDVININGTKKFDLTVTGSRAQALFYTNSTDAITTQCAYTLDRTAMGQPDPFVSLLRDINSFGFLSSLYLGGAGLVAPDDRQKFETTNLTMSVSGYNQEYETDYGFLIAAVVVTVFSVACVLPVYWGFWELGRETTLEPLEIATALQAPVLLSGTTTQSRSGEIDNVLEEVGKREVLYGILPGEAPDAMRLAIAPPEQVMPLRGKRQ